MAHPLTEAAREQKLVAADAMGIDEGFIDLMVEHFYAQIRIDAELGPIFNARIANWPAHLARMKAFWTAVLRGGGGFSGNPMLKHVAIPAIEQAEFDRWLSLFDATLHEIERDPAATALINQRARTIAESLLLGIRIHRDRRDPAAFAGEVHA